MTAGDRELFLDYLKNEGYLTEKDFRYIGTGGRGYDVNPGAGVDPGPGIASKPHPLNRATFLQVAHYLGDIASR